MTFVYFLVTSRRKNSQDAIQCESVHTVWALQSSGNRGAPNITSTRLDIGAEEGWPQGGAGADRGLEQCAALRERRVSLPVQHHRPRLWLRRRPRPSVSGCKEDCQECTLIEARVCQIGISMHPFIDTSCN